MDKFNLSTNLHYRCISGVTTTRFVSACLHTNRKISSSKTSQHSCTFSDLDSHADTCCLGSNCCITSKSGKVVNVKPFTDELSSVQEIEIGSGETAYTCSNGETYILIINEGLIFGDRLENTLLTPNQMRSNGITVEDTPTQFDRRSRHTIVGADDHGDDVTLPLTLRGVISYLSTRYPTEEEQRNCRRTTLTSDVEWDPYCDSYSAAETRCTSAVTTDTLLGEKTKINVDPVGITTHQGDIQQLFDMIKICAASRDLSPELLPLSENTTRIVSSVNIASDDIDGDGTK